MRKITLLVCALAGFFAIGQNNQSTIAEELAAQEQLTQMSNSVIDVNDLFTKYDNLGLQTGDITEFFTPLEISLMRAQKKKEGNAVRGGEADWIPTAGATEVFEPAVGDFFFDTGGPGGTPYPGYDGPGDYINCGCGTYTTLAGVSQIEFLDFSVFATFDWLRIYDGTDTSGVLLYDNSSGGMNAGDILLADMIASHGSTIFTASSGNFHFEFWASTVVAYLGWEVEILEASGGGGGGDPVAYGYEAAVYGFGNFDLADPSVFNTVSGGSGTSGFEGAGAISHDDPTLGYAIDNIGNMYQIDVPSGVYTLLGNVGVTDITGLEFNPVDNSLWAVRGEGSGGHLYSVNPAGPSVTLIGNMGIPAGDFALALGIDDSGNFYTYETNIVTNSNLYSINPATGAATVIGSLGFQANFGQGMGFDTSTNTMYMAAFNNLTFDAELRTVNLATGLSTLIGSIVPGELTQVAWLSIIGDTSGGGGDCSSPVVDINQDASNTCMAFISQTGIAQSFTAESDTSAGAGFMFTTTVAAGQTLEVGLWDNLPNAGGVLLTSGSVTTPGGDAWVDVYWDTPASTTIGDMYYLVVEGNVLECMGGTTYDSYPGGHLYANSGYGPFPDWDYTFRHYGCEGGGGGGDCEPGDLTTIFTGGNQFAGNMFDITASGGEDVQIENFDINMDSGSGLISVYYKSGSYIGFESDASAWTLLGAETVTSMGENNPTPLNVGGLTIPAGETYGIYISSTDHPTNNFTMNYTNGDFNYTDAYMTIETGVGKGSPDFTGSTFASRSWNGTVYYCAGEGGGGGGDCEWEVHVFDTTGNLGDEVTWQLLDGATVLLSGGPYFTTPYNDVQTIMAGNGPLTFQISSMGIFNDNTPSYTVTAGGTEVASGTLAGGTQAIHEDLMCDGSGGNDPVGDCDEANERGTTIVDGLNCSVNSTFKTANDLTVPADYDFHLEQIRANILTIGEVTEVSVYYYDNNTGTNLPGTQLDSEMNLVPTEQTWNGSAFGFDVYEIILDIPTYIFSGQESTETTYWIELEVNNASSSGSIYWELTNENSQGNPAALLDGGWMVWDPTMDGVYLWGGNCVEIISSEEMTISGFSYYPNPASDVIYLQADQIIDSVDLYNVLGQQVLSQSVNAQSSQLDVSGLASGTYLMSVESEGTLHTYQVIKK